MITCKRCKKPFKTCTKINGKKVSLGARIHCLDCAPYKTQTRIRHPYILPKGFKWCNQCLKSKIESDFYYNKGKQKVDSVCKVCRKLNGHELRKKFKLACLAYKQTASCELCGYNKSYKALDFHHLDPNKKEFHMAEYSATRLELTDKVKKELDKCQVVCANCHRELS